MNEERLEHDRNQSRKCGHALSVPHSIRQSTDIALPGQSVSQRERERERERERGRGEKGVEYGCFIFIFNRNDKSLGTF
jgi:hypothetical protein